MTSDPATGPGSAGGSWETDPDDDTDAPARLLAGAPSPDRRRFPKTGSSPRWFEPDHVQDPSRVRSELADQIAAGADVVLAPTFLTHRRALLPVGESRRAREWTNAAVRVAREAIEEGLGKREALPDGPPPGPVEVFGVLPDPDAAPESGAGRLVPREAATERDEADQVGILADADVDAIVVEPRRSVARVEGAAAVAVQTGVPAWIAVAVDAAGWLATGEPLEAAVETIVALDPAGLLLVLDHAEPVPELMARLAAAARGLPAGVVASSLRSDVDTAAGVETAARGWLETGVQLIGLTDGATPAALGPFRAARDAVASARGETRARREREWLDWVRDAAQRAPGGRAAWLGAGPTHFPAGFAWTLLPRSQDAAALAEADYRLVIARDRIDPRTAARLLEPGGVMAAVLSPDGASTLATLDSMRILDLRPGVRSSRVIARRDG